jgi:hypothetical protein
MDKDRLAANLAAVENHFHSEALNEVEEALKTFTDDMASTDRSPGRKLPPRITGNSSRRCVT